MAICRTAVEIQFSTPLSTAAKREIFILNRIAEAVVGGVEVSKQAFVPFQKGSR